MEAFSASFALEPLLSCISWINIGTIGGWSLRIVEQVVEEEERLTRTKHASEETGSKGSLRREARAARTAGQDKAAAPSAEADKPSTFRQGCYLMQKHGFKVLICVQHRHHCLLGVS